MRVNRLFWKLITRWIVENGCDAACSRLAQNAIAGKDGGAQSAKILGSDRRVNMFTPDGQVGVTV